MILGVHAAVYRGHAAAAARAAALGARAIQVLPYRRHSRPTAEECAEFREDCRAARLDRILVHSRFVPSPASSDVERRSRSAAHLTEELRLTSALGGEAFVIHGGAYSPEGTSTQGIALFAETLARAVGESACAARILLENVPGGGRRMGGSLEELARLCEATAARGVTKWGLCLDTAHAWAAGDDVSSPEGIAAFVARARALCGANAIRAYHLNDSGVARGSRLENHAPWGAGSLGTAGLAALMKSRSETDVVGILESPAGFDGADFAMAVRLATV